MIRPTLISFLVHSAILLAAVVALPDPEEFDVKTSEAVPVEILSEEELVKPKPVEKPPEPVKKVEPPKPKPEKKQVAALPPEPEPEPSPVEKPPEPEPVVEKPPEPEPEVVPEKVEEPPKQVRKVYPKPQRKPKPPKRVAKKDPKKHDDTIEALLNKLPDETSAPSPEVEEEAETDLTSTADLSREGTQFEREEIAEIVRAKMQRCWNPPAGSKDAHSLKVSFKLSFRQNGEFSRSPQSQTPAGDPLTRAAVESAQRALIRCAPYILPAETYDVWKDMVLNFRPSAMF